MKSFKLLICCFTFYFVYVNTTQAQWQWAKSIGGSYDDGAGILHDENGNSYCIGNFSGLCYFQTDTLLAKGCSDYFLAKYDGLGNEMWVKQFGSLNDNCGTYIKDYLNSLYIDTNSHSILLGGKYSYSIGIDGQSLTGQIGNHIFLAKLDYNGTCQWLKRATSLTGFEVSAMALACDSNSNVFWSGILDRSGFVDTVAVSAGTFLTKFDMNGNILWAKNEIDGAEITNAIVTSNAIYIAGVTRNDTIRIDTLTIQRQYAVDSYVAKLDLSGKLIWAKVFGGTSDDYGIGLRIDENKNVYVSGKFYDNFEIDSVQLSNNNKYDMFLIKLDSNAHFKWLKQSHASGIYGAVAYSIAYQNGSIYLTGSISGNATFGAINLSTNSGNQDMFLAKYDTLGNVLMVEHFGEAQAFGIQLDGNGNSYSCGTFKSTVSVGNSSLTSRGGDDVFIAKYNDLTGIRSAGNKSNRELFIHANPNAGKCSISIPEEFAHEKKLELYIYNSNGRLIQQKSLEINQGKVKVSLEAEAKGLYHAVLSNGNKMFSGKIVFE